MDVVISFGGSVFVHDEVNIEYLKKFKKWVVGLDLKVGIVVGGGSLARKYQSLVKGSIEDLDWIGIRTTWLNAELVRVFFGEFAYRKVLHNPTKRVKYGKILFCGGWKPGWSTDYVSVVLAETYCARKVINLSNIDYVYDKDPKVKGAKKLENLSWDELLDITGDEWVPGKNVPFDPIAAKLCKKNRVSVGLMNGNDLDNVTNYLNGKEFKGTRIS